MSASSTPNVEFRGLTSTDTCENYRKRNFELNARNQTPALKKLRNRKVKDNKHGSLCVVIVKLSRINFALGGK